MNSGKLEGEHFLHNDMWGVATDHRRGEHQYDHLVAMVFAFHALEGYLSYVGEKVITDHKELARFRNFGPPRKLSYLRNECCLPALDAGPGTTIGTLKEFRDLVAHPQPRPITSADNAAPYWSEFVTPAKAEASLQEVKEIAEALYSYCVIKSLPDSTCVCQ
jgi:hypothetical protein